MTRGRWLTPDGLPAGLRSCVLQFPDSEEWHALVRGCLFLLSEERNFEEFGSVSVADVADTFRQTLFKFLEDDCLLVPIGAILEFAGSVLPDRFDWCDGEELSRVDFAELYAIVGDVFGDGNGTTTFNKPDRRGRVGVGFDGDGFTFDSLGGTGGAAVHTLSAAELPVITVIQNSHNHGENPHNHAQDAHDHIVYGITLGSTGSVRDTLAAASQPANKTTATKVATNQAATAVNVAATATNQSFGSGASHQNMPPYLVLNHIIRVL